jgi:serine/threonine-protein kinase
MDVGACTDLWALGCVLYEMATGRRVFEGKSQASLIAAIMTAEVRPMTELAPLAPAALDRLVRALLAKAPDDRPQSAHDAKLVLEWIAAGEMNTPGRGVSGRPATLRTRTWIALAAVLAVVATVGFALGLRRGGHSRVEPRPILHTTIPLQKNTILSGWASPTVALSSDGRSLAYVATSPDGTRRLYVRRLESEETAPVPNSEEAEGPMFSPDGQWVAFAVGVSSGIRRGEMLKYSLATGLTQSICELSDYFGGQWRDDGTILFVNQLSHGLWTVSSAGGRPEPIASSFLVDGKETGLAMRWPQVLPGGQRVISPTGGRLVVIDLRTRELKDTGIRTSFARYSPTGHLLYTTTDDVLMAVPFDPVQGKPIGPAVAVMRDVSQSCNGASVFAFSGNGAFVYATGPLRGSGQEISNVVHIDRRGEIHPLPIEPEFFGRRISLSPDGHRLVVPIQEDLWVYDLVRGTRIKLPKGDMDDCMYPAWAPDGRSLAFSGLRTGATNFDLYQQVADGIALPERLGGTPIEDQVNSFTPDGRAVVFRTFDSQGKSALWLCPLDPRGEPTQLTSGLQKEISARVSPDGRMIAYEGVESDRQELFLTTFPQIGARVPVSQDGGNTPRWSSDGRRIVFANRGRLYSVSVDPGPDIHVGPPEPLFDIPGIALWDPLPDDSGIIALRTDPEAGRQTQVQLVVNWFDELRRLSPVAR